MKKKVANKAAGLLTRPFFIGDELCLFIDRLAYHSGQGVARHQGFVVFVPFTAPGDKVNAKVVRLHPSYAEAELIEVLEPGPARRAPPCPVAGRCGGCQWQHVAYEEQLAQKQNILIHALKGLPLGDLKLPLEPFVGSPQEFRYRNRIQIHVQGEKLGYFAAGTRDMVEVQDCLIAEKALVEQFPLISARRDLDRGRVEIARLETGEVELRQGEAEAHSHRFAQINEQQNKRLIEILISLVQNSKFSEIVDLYCGAGNLTFPLAKAFPGASVHAVDLSRVMIDTAQKRAYRLPRQSSIEWKAEPVSQFLAGFRPRDRDWLLVLDPPRPGCDRDSRNLILKLRPRQIVYVSCNPSTLARDLEPWLKSGLYRLDFVQGLDMFPQTAHLEALVSLVARAD